MEVFNIPISDIGVVFSVFCVMVGAFRVVVINPIRKDISNLSQTIGSLNTKLDKLEQEDKHLTERIYSLEVQIAEIKQQIKTLFNKKGD